MRSLLILTATLAWYGAHARAQEPSPAPTAPAPASGEDKHKYTAEESKHLNAIIAEVQTLAAHKHYLDALLKIDEAEAIAPNSAIVWNIRGSVYTTYRDFEKAREAFNKAHEAAPNAFEPQVNLAELLYVEHKYEEVEPTYRELLKKFPKLREYVRHLVIFKLLVCELKLGKVADAEETIKNFTPTDDTPAFYFSKAAFAYQANHAEEAATWVAKAQRIFTAERNSVYIDALEEAKWLNATTSATPPKPEKPGATAK